MKLVEIVSCHEIVFKISSSWNLSSKLSIVTKLFSMALFSNISSKLHHGCSPERLELARHLIRHDIDMKQEKHYNASLYRVKCLYCLSLFSDSIVGAKCYAFTLFNME